MGQAGSWAYTNVEGWRLAEVTAVRQLVGKSTSALGRAGVESGEADGRSGGAVGAYGAPGLTGKWRRGAGPAAVAALQQQRQGQRQRGSTWRGPGSGRAATVTVLVPSAAARLWPPAAAASCGGTGRMGPTNDGAVLQQAGRERG